MKISKFFAVMAIVFASFIQVGCGSANQQNTLGYNQNPNGCPVGQTYINGYCQVSYNNGYNNTNTGACAQGQSYQYTGGTYGSCNPGYALQGLTCTCQTGGTISQNTGVTGGLQQGSCRAGYLQTPYGCYEQGPCRPGDAYITPYGQCYHQGY
jgi:hypothetical protein